ncbi:MAG TPA: alpha/beta hydrolase [bacterium]|nr:alpha/beta hydrolase [bacterium]
MNLIFPGADYPHKPNAFGTPIAAEAEGRRIYLLVDDQIDPHQAKAVALYFHGNAEVVEDLDYVPPFFRRETWLTVLVEFPGYGHCPGVPGESSFYQAGLDAYDYVAKNLCPGLPVVVAAWSLGTPAAMYLAAQRKVAHLFLLSAMTSMVEVAQALYPMTPDLYFKDARFEVKGFWDKIQAPVTLIHGDEDEIVPVNMSRELKRHWQDQAELYEIPEGGHNDIYLLGAATIRQSLEKIAKGLTGAS